MTRLDRTCLRLATLAICASVTSTALAQPAPTSGTCCYSELEILAEGFKSKLPDQPAVPLAGRVSINGRYIGDTPLADGFPAGDYEIVVEYQGVVAYNQVVRLVAGQRSRIVARAELPLTFEEAGRLEAEQRAARAAATAERRRRQKDAHLAAVAAWNVERAQWERETAQPRARRRVLGTTGWITLGAGAALGITGGALIGAASGQSTEAQVLFDEWKTETDADERAVLEAQIDDTQQKRDAMQGAGVALVVTGGAALVTGVVLLMLRPSIAPEPEYPSERFARLRVTPYAATNAAGLVLDGQF